MRLPLTARLAAFAALALTATALLSSPARAQAVAGSPGSGDTFKDTSQLKLPAGQRAAIYEFEDLECPACAHAFPIVHAAVDRYKIPLLRHDFPLHEIHVWSTEAAITARYLQDKVSADAGEQFRRDVFASQLSINSKDDLLNFTRKWFQGHNQQLPFVVDPTRRFAAEVQADRTLGERLGLLHTPTIFVISPRGWTQVTDVGQLYATIDKALAESPVKAAATAAPAKPAPHNNVRKAATPQK